MNMQWHKTMVLIPTMYIYIPSVYVNLWTARGASACRICTLLAPTVLMVTSAPSQKFTSLLIVGNATGTLCHVITIHSFVRNSAFMYNPLNMSA